MRYMILFLVPFFICACSTLPPALNILSVFDLYSSSQDSRDIYIQTKDKIIKTNIQSQILAHKTLSNYDIDVESFYGEVLLIGEINTKNDEQKAIDIAKSVSGVNKIRTFLIPKNANSCSIYENNSILLKLKKEFYTDNVVKGSTIRVNVIQCKVILSGVVNTTNELKHIMWYSTHIDNVDEVYSFIHVFEELKNKKD
ncbi:BON domain-containing protein [Campylobacter sputorum]|uniref:BON domain-containing protein n=1 Tax=Campylobacter sputorum TaxID=206 RepID=UPI00053BDF2C|nr:BON domain-containing protein [Campylobacter sputorum]